MPRIVDLGAPYGPTSFPDGATDADVLSQYDALEAARIKAAKEARMVTVRLADLAENEKPTIGKIATATGLNIREVAVGTTKQAVGNIARIAADAFSIPQSSLQSRASVKVDTQDPEHPLNILREAGKDIASKGDEQLRQAGELAESIGGGLPTRIAASLGSTAGASAPALLGAPFGITAAYIAAGLHGGGSNISQFKDRLMELNPNLTEQEAFDKAKIPGAITGVVTGVLTRTFGGVEKLIEKIATEGIKETGVKALLTGAFKAASMEFPEEYLDQLAQGFTEKAFVDPKKDVGDIFNEAGLAGLAGFALGGLTAGGVMIPFEAARVASDAIDRSRVRRQSNAESRQRIASVIQQKESSPATITGSNVQHGTEMPAEVGAGTVGVPIPAPESVPSAVDQPQPLSEITKEQAPAPDKIDAALTKVIEALQNDPTKVQSQVVPVWIVQDAARVALIATRAAYRGGKAVVEAIGDGINALRALPGFNEQEANRWLTQAVSDELMPSIGQAQVTGTAADVGRIADEIYSRRETGAAGLEQLGYERRQYRSAASELKRVAGIAYGRFGASAQENPAVNPDPDEGVSIEDGQLVVDDSFSNTLAAIGVPHNVENTKAMQAEVFFEKAARRVLNLSSRIGTLHSARSSLVGLKADQETIDSVDQQIASLNKQLERLMAAEHNGQTVGGRASEISAANHERPQMMAQRQALSLDPVAEFFGKNVGAYRNFRESAVAASKLSAALNSESVDPDEMARLSKETEEWIRLPSDIQQAIRAGTALTDEQKASAFASLSQVFEQFDMLRARMGEMASIRIPELLKRERELMLEIANAKIDAGTAEIMISDVLAALDGETGGTGSLQGQQVSQALKQRLSAIQSFTSAIGNDIETHKALFEWLTNPTERKQFITSASQAYGADQATLEMILDESQRNPAFSSAIVTLIQSSDKKMSQMPSEQLKLLEELVQGGQVESARTLASQLSQKAEARSGVAEAALRNGLRELEKVNIERMALENGVLMFDELAASGEFTGLRGTVSNSPFGFVEPMVDQNNTITTFKAFGKEGIPSMPELQLKASDSVVFKAEWMRKVHEWHVKAQEHLDAYDVAEMANRSNPVANPPPAVLGFDMPKIRGLRDAASRHVPGSFLELSLLSEDKRWKIPGLARFFAKASWSRQHDFVSKMVGGIAGTDLRGRLADFTNYYLLTQSIKGKYSDIPRLRHLALKSHPNLQGNMMEYRKLWNELSHWGRMFDSPIRAGFVLPNSGVTVTQEDMELLRKQIAYEEELRRRVTEAHSVGGVRMKVGDRDLVRAGAYVGDKGLPRHLNRRANSFIADVLAAYGPNQGFNPQSNLSSSSNDPIVQFWNSHVPMLVQHILDVRRTDRAMRLNQVMQRTEGAAATTWMSTGVPAITSLEGLINELVSHAPGTPGYNTRDVVIKGLNEELKQYRDAAKRIENERAERDRARNSGVDIAFSADNEFTKPAAQLELPSELYDYGAITDAEHITVASRANHERIVAYATSVQRAVSDLSDRINRYESSGGLMSEAEALKSVGGQVLYSGNIEEAQQVLGILRKIGEDFEAAYRANNTSGIQAKWWRDTLGLFTSAVLALPTVGLRNMTQGQFETYMMSRAMGISGHRMAMWRAMKQMVKTVTRAGLSVGSNLMRRLDLGVEYTTGKNFKVFSDMVDQIAKLLMQPNFRADADRVHELGFDTREGFMDRLRRIWDETAEYSSLEDNRKTSANIGGEKRKVAEVATIPFKVARALFDKIGVQQYDQVINSSLLVYSSWLEKRLAEVAVVYGDARERAGLTDFSAIDPKWKLQPDEWAAFPTYQGNADSLAFMQLFLEGSVNPEGFQLEKNLWDYYKAKKAGQHPRMFTDAQFSAVQQKLLAEFNASTPANRSSASAGNPVLRNLQVLHSYVTDGLLKLINTTFGGTRDRSMTVAALGRVPIMTMLAFMSVIIGYAAGSLTGAWQKLFEKQVAALPNPLDKDFWSDWKRWAMGTSSLGAMNLFYIGDLILALRGEVQGNRGFDPIGRVFPISVAQRFFNSVRGMYSTYKGGKDVSDTLAPMFDMTRSMVPYWKTAEAALGYQKNEIKQGDRIANAELNNLGLLPASRMNMMTGPAYGPTTIVRRNITDYVSQYYNATQANDAAGAAKALESAKGELTKLERFYYDKYIAAEMTPEQAAIKSKRDLWNDYQELNPIVSAAMGKRLTESQYQLLRKNITGDRSAMVDKAINAWQSGSMALFGRQGQITREDVAEGRRSLPGIPGGAGLTSPLGRGSLRSPLASSQRSSMRRPRASGGLRMASLGGSMRTRRSRGTGIRRRRVGVTRRISSPRIARSRTTLGSRRRRAYA